MKKDKHKHKLVFYETYESGDCYMYHIVCKVPRCRFKIHEWTMKELERKFEELTNKKIKN